MAQDYLGVFYATGQGVTKNYAEAAKWFRKAAEQNFAKAQSHLGLSYAEGEGVPKDYVEGYRWVLLAAGQGDEGAKEYVTTLENAMSREQIAEGQKLARNFTPRELPSERSDSSSAGIAQTRRNLRERASLSLRMAILSQMNMCLETEHRCGWLQPAASSLRKW